MIEEISNKHVYVMEFLVSGIALGNCQACLFDTQDLEFSIQLTCSGKVLSLRGTTAPILFEISSLKSFLPGFVLYA
jgi:hypothetical protein